MKSRYNLRPPRRAGGFWSLRGTYANTRFEVSTQRTEHADAEVWAALYWEMIKADPIMNAEDPRSPGTIDLQPEAVALGIFEVWLMTNFVIVGENIVRLGDGKVISFHLASGGYRQAQLRWEGRDKRVLEHRWKFLLHHRWLPRSVDHRNCVRHDNRLENLRAATPKMQSANRRGAKKDGAAPRIFPE